MVEGMSLVVHVMFSLVNVMSHNLLELQDMSAVNVTSQSQAVHDNIIQLKSGYKINILP